MFCLIFQMFQYTKRILGYIRQVNIGDYIPTSYASMKLIRNTPHLFPEKELCSLSPNSYIHVFVSDLYIPRIGPHLWLQKNRRSEPGNI